MTQIREKISELRKAVEAADPAPWEARVERSSSALTERMFLIGKDPYMPWEINIMYYRNPEANIHFISLARNTIPDILDYVAKLERVVEEATQYVKLWAWDDIASENTSINSVMVAPWCNEELIPTQLRDAIAALRELGGE